MKYFCGRPLVSLVSFAAGLCMVFSAGCRAQSAANPAERTTAAASAPSTADIASVKKAIEAKLKAGVDDVRPVGFAGLYEVRVGSEVVYTDAGASHLFVGNIIDMNSRANLTRERVDEIAEATAPKMKFSDFPLDSAIKRVYGGGKRQLVIFQDPNCGYCKKLESTLAEADNVTLYVFLYPVLGPDSTEKSKAIWCSADPARTWNNWMRSNIAIPPLPAGKACSAPIETVVDLGKKLKVNGTPTLFFPNGKRIPGAVDGGELKRLLTENG